MRGFSWKRAIGISSFKAKVARATGIPTTRSGRARKWGFWPILTRMASPGKAARDETDAGGGCSGCLVLLLLMGGCGYALSYLPSSRPQRLDAPTPTPEVNPQPIPALKETPLPPAIPLLDVVSSESSVVIESTPQVVAPEATDYKHAHPEAYGQSQLNLAKQYLKLKKTDKARQILEAMIEQVPNTDAAAAAKREIERLPH